MTRHVRGSAQVFWLACLMTLTGIVSAQEVYFPARGSDWSTRDPAELGVDAVALHDAVQFALANEYSGERDLRVPILRAFEREPYHEIVGSTKRRGGPAGIVLKSGHIIAEWGDTSRVDMTFSVTKSYLSTVVGLAWDAGLIESLDDPVVRYVQDGTFDGEHNERITWHHLLNQSSDWSGVLFGMPDWGDRPPRDGGIDEWRSRALNSPGAVYEYNDVRVNVLAYAALQVWRQPLPVILKERIMDPIGSSTAWRWHGYETSWVDVDGLKVQSVSGGGHSGGGLFISTRDHARFGLLFLRKGRWNGRQLISEAWIERARRSSEANASYGYMWWLNRGQRKVEGLSETIFFAAGFGGNYIVVDEEHDLVVVIRWLEPQQLGELLRRVIASMK
jgi:CubicO group peptidase (beta-lactamase class C family)